VLTSRPTSITVNCRPICTIRELSWPTSYTDGQLTNLNKINYDVPIADAILTREEITSRTGCNASTSPQKIELQTPQLRFAVGLQLVVASVSCNRVRGYNN